MRKFIFILVFVMTASNSFAWEPEAWRKYVISLEVEQDTVRQPSIMLRGLRRTDGHRISPLATATKVYYFYQLGLFETEDDLRDWQRAITGDYTTGDFIVDVMFDVLDGFFSK